MSPLSPKSTWCMVLGAASQPLHLGVSLGGDLASFSFQLILEGCLKLPQNGWGFLQTNLAGRDRSLAGFFSLQVDLALLPAVDAAPEVDTLGQSLARS